MKLTNKAKGNLAGILLILPSGALFAWLTQWLWHMGWWLPRIVAFMCGFATFGFIAAILAALGDIIYPGKEEQ